MALRITGGSLGGRRLRAPREGARPTADRVRESLFARLGDLADARVLDLFAGSGVLGFEALSRGASSLVSVERSRASAELIRQNAAALGVAERVRVLRQDAGAALRRLGRAGERFDLVLLDPPYAEGAAEPTLAALAASGVLAPGAAVVLERARSHPVPTIAGLVLEDERRFGDTVIGRYAAAGADDEARSEPGGRSTS
jgi:16S rRNA (guanine966-N2)-methyltransferase